MIFPPEAATNDSGRILNMNSENYPRDRSGEQPVPARPGAITTSPGRSERSVICDFNDIPLTKLKFA
jgi:hypothetical protein